MKTDAALLSEVSKDRLDYSLTYDIATRDCILHLTLPQGLYEAEKMETISRDTL